MSAPEIKLRNAKGQIERIAEFMRTHKPDQPGVAFDTFKIRQEALEDSYQEFNHYHEEVTLLQLQSTKMSDEVLDAHSALLIQMEELVYQLEEDIRHALSVLSNQRTASNATPFGSLIVNQTEVRLPPITIAPFSGDASKWTAFHNMFLCTVHNNASLQKVEKLQYLKSLLKDEAIQLISNIPIIAKNYETAWEKLKSRYDNKNLVVQKHNFMKPQATHYQIQSTKSKKGSSGKSALGSTTQQSSLAEVREPQFPIQSSSFSNQLSTSSSSRSTRSIQSNQSNHFDGLEVAASNQSNHSGRPGDAAVVKSCHTIQCVPKSLGLGPNVVMKCQNQYGNLQSSQGDVNQLWCSSPNCLSQGQELWSVQTKSACQQKGPEEKMSHQSVIKYSSSTNLIRISSLCSRFISNCHRKEAERRYGQLTTNYTKPATEVSIKFAQASTFSAEVKVVSDEAHISSTNKLKSLHPYLDKNGLQRVSN